MEKLKILIIGEQKSGKSVISNYLYQDDRQTPKIYRPTIGLRVLEFERRLNINGQDQLAKIQLWDVSGNLDYESTWNVPQEQVDGIIICGNGDNNYYKEETEGWINSFPKKMKLPPSNCIGFLNHPSGILPNQNKQIQISSVTFYHSCFEKRGLTIGPVFDKFIQKIFQNKIQRTDESNQLCINYNYGLENTILQ